MRLSFATKYYVELLQRRPPDRKEWKEIRERLLVHTMKGIRWQ